MTLDLARDGDSPPQELGMAHFNYNALYGLDEKDRRAEAAIANAAFRLAGLKIAFGIMGNLFPFGTVLSTAAGVAVQGPKILTPLMRQIATIYDEQPDQQIEKIGRYGAYGAGIADFLAEFGTLLGTDIAAELATEVLGMIPILGVGADVAISTTVCWRCGVLCAAYFNNGQQWVGNRTTTYRRAKAIVGNFNPKIVHRVNLSDVRKVNPEIQASQAAFVGSLISMMRAVNPGATKAELRAALIQRRIPSDIIDSVLT